MEIRADIVQRLWSDLVKTPFDLNDFINGVIRDCGVDGAALSRDQLLNCLTGIENVDWKSLAFAFDEGLAAYIAQRKMSKEEFVRCVFMILCLVESIKRGFGDWEFSFDKIVRLVCMNMSKGDYLFRMKLLSSVLGGLENAI
jgi:hypothetical protein